MKNNNISTNTVMASSGLMTNQGEGDHQALLATLYGFLSDPQEFEAFFEQLDRQLLQLAAEFGDANENVDVAAANLSLSQIDFHFSCAAQIFDRIGLHKPDVRHIGVATDEINPQWIFNKCGKLVWQNNQAQGTLGLELQSHYREISDDFEFLAVCEKEYAQPTSDDEPTLRVVVLSGDDANAAQQLFLVQQSRHDDPDHHLHVSHCQLDWSQHIGSLLEQSFGLSSTEQDILKGVVEGRNLVDIATERNRSVETIRTQSKSLLRKTGAKSQVGLVRLFAAISLSMPNQKSTNAADQTTNSHQLRTSFFKTDKGLKIQVDEYGSKAGYPVFLFHGLFSGTGLTEKASSYIAQSGLRIIAPWRPGWNKSTNAEWAYQDAPQEFAKIVRQIMDHYGFEQAAMVGRFTGGIYAAAAAQALGERVSSTILLSPTAPVTDKAQLRTMKGWQRVFAYAITYTPSVVPILVRGMRQFLFRQEVEKFMAGFYASPSADAEASKKPEIQKLIERQVENSFAQGTKPHEQDLMLTGSDWSRYLLDIPSPLLVMHGTHNPVDTIERAEALAVFANAASLLSFPDAGQLFVHSEPEKVWDHIRRFMRSGGNAG